MTSHHHWPVAIVGSGNIGTDLMMKVLRSDGPLTMGAMVGIDADSDGLARAKRMGVPTTATGIDGLLAMPEFADIKLVFFDATSASAHRANWAKLVGTDVRALDLTPAAVGPYCVPVVNLDDHLDAPNLNMVTCGGQATVPIVAAVGQVASCPTPRSCRRSRRSRLVRGGHGPTSTNSPRPPLRHCARSVVLRGPAP